MLLVIGVAFYIGAIQLPLSMNVYSPPAAYLSPSRSEGRVYGRVLYLNDTPAVGIEIRLFATDQLIEDRVTTDYDGYFMSNVFFDAGQIITVSFVGLELQRFQEFVPYDMQDDFEFFIGLFVIEP